MTPSVEPDGGPPAPPRPPGGDETPWVETPAGGLFFLNAVLVAPIGIVLFPLLLGGLLRALGLIHGTSLILDPVPAVAAYWGPWIGWIYAVPLALTVKNLTMVDRAGPRTWLVVFLLAEVGVLCWTAVQWFR